MEGVPTCAAFLCSTTTTLVSRESLNSCSSSITTGLEASPAVVGLFGVLQSEETEDWGPQEMEDWGAQETEDWGAQEMEDWESQETDEFVLEDSFSGVEESLPRERNERSKEMLSSSEGVSWLWSAPLLDCLSCGCCT